jgi:prepilin-type N-terminal cleavage/methylation domain-containing protein
MLPAAAAIDLERQSDSMTRRSNHSGFTLVELALVVTIIAILVVAVLKGQNMVFDTRVAGTMSIANDLSSASKTFKDRFHYLPGDLPNPGNNIPNLPAACTGLTSTPMTPFVGDGQINSAVEASCAIEELFQLGMIKADPDPSNLPFHMIQNPFTSGTVRLVSVAFAAPYSGAWPATTTNLIEFQNLPCDAALAIDTKIDDGILSSGKAMASVPTCLIGTGASVPLFALTLN